MKIGFTQDLKKVIKRYVTIYKVERVVICCREFYKFSLETDDIYPF